MSEQLASFDEFHDKVDAEIILEHVLHVHDKWMFDGVQYILLKLDVLKLFIIDDYIFADALHSINLLRVLVLHQIYLPERAFANHFEDLKIAQLRHWRHIRTGHHVGASTISSRFLLLSGEYQVTSLLHALHSLMNILKVTYHPGCRLLARVWHRVAILIVLFFIVVLFGHFGLLIHLASEL